MPDTIIINVPSERYTELLKNEALYRALVDAILGSAHLGYDKKSLSFRDETIATMLNIVDPEATKATLARLQAVEVE